MAIEVHVCPPREGKREPRWLERRIAESAARQYGVVTRAQLLEAGFSGGAIDGRIASGLLRPLHRGVFAVGHRALTREGWWMAAVLSAGPGAALSHRSAAAFWAIRSDTRRRIEVTVPRNRRSTSRVEIHRARTRDDETQDENGIRVTTPARTLFDLAAVVPFHQLEAAFNEAEYR